MSIEDYQKIISSDNKQIKILEKLNSKKYREEFSQFIVENLAIILDALKDGHDFESLFVTEEFAAKHPEQLLYFKNNSQAKNFYLIDSKLNKKYSGLDTPSGITAIYSIKKKELNPDDFKFYLEAFKYGMPPEGGLAIGLERMTARLLEIDNVKYATLFPRDLNRIDLQISPPEYKQ